MEIAPVLMAIESGSLQERKRGKVGCSTRNYAKWWIREGNYIMRAGKLCAVVIPFGLGHNQKTSSSFLDSSDISRIPRAFGKPTTDILRFAISPDHKNILMTHTKSVQDIYSRFSREDHAWA